MSSTGYNIAVNSSGNLPVSISSTHLSWTGNYQLNPSVSSASVVGKSNLSNGHGASIPVTEYKVAGTGSNASTTTYYWVGVNNGFPYKIEATNSVTSSQLTWTLANSTIPGLVNGTASGRT